ncbi:MAG: hypothetical protein KKD44_02470 [Proteobacteria bacterium]|nr:hypothetical protein [Pseudomonadota bacterium]
MEKRYTHSFLLWFFVLMLVVIAGCKSRSTPAPPGVTPPRINLDLKTGLLTIKAEKASLFKIIKELNEQHELDVVVPQLSKDRTVSVDISDMPVNEALSQLIPHDLKYYFQAKNMEIKIPGKTGDKKADENKTPKSKSLPTKDKTRPLDPQEKIVVKDKPDERQPEKFSDGEQNSKVHPKKSPAMEQTKRKIPRKKEAEGYHYARLNLYIDMENTIRIEQFSDIEGRLIESDTYNGQFFYVAFLGTDIVTVGSMQDPLLVRSIDEQPGSYTSRAKHGFFSISIPDTFLKRENLSKAALDFYFLEEDSGMPDKISPSMFGKIEKQLKRIAVINSEELIKSFDKTQAGRVTR